MTWDIATQVPGRAMRAAASGLRAPRVPALSTAATSGARNAHVWAPLAAAAIVAILVGLAVVTVSATVNSAATRHAPSRRGGLFHGYDRRWSTSKTMAALWTIVLAFMVITEALIAISGNGTFPHSATTDFAGFMAHTLDSPPNRDLYLVLLGGPYAAAIFSKAVVTSRVNSGKLQKTDGTPGQISDVVSNDAGAVDLYDLQYTMFNLIALVITVSAFCANEAGGLPDLPNFLAFLTGGAALTYSVNKGVTTNQPMLTAVHPQAARVGDRVTAYGNNLTAVASADSLKAAVAGVDALVQPSPAATEGSPVAGSADEVNFLIPSPPASVAWAPGDRQQVSVTTAAGLVASLNDALAVVPDQPVAVRLSPALLMVASAAEYADIPVTMQGQYLATPGATKADTATAQISIRGPDTAATTTARYVDDHRVSFNLPPDTPVPAAGQQLVFQVQLYRGTSSTQPLTLTVKPAPRPELDVVNPGLIIADPGTSLAGQSIALTGASLMPPSPSPGSPRHVAQAGAEPLRATVTDVITGGAVGQLAGQPRSATAATVTLLAPLAIADTGESTVTIALERGSLSSGAQTLTLRARHDPAMTVTVITAPAQTPLAGYEVTVSSHVFSVNLPAGEPGQHIAASRATLLARVSADGVSLDVPDLPAVPDGQTDLTFRLPAGTPVMPATPADGTSWKIQISRNGHVIATGDLILRNQRA